jgi:hypothetical protein
MMLLSVMHKVKLNVTMKYKSNNLKKCHTCRVCTLTLSPIFILAFLVTVKSQGELDPKWALWYSEDFSTPLNDATVPWVLDNYSEPFDNIVDDNGLWYPNDYGPAWIDQLNSFHTYRKEFAVGQDGWLTASLSARDWNRDGTIESPPTLTIKLLGNRNVAEMKVPDHS